MPINERKLNSIFSEFYVLRQFWMEDYPLSMGVQNNKRYPLKSPSQL